MTRERAKTVHATSLAASQQMMVSEEEEEEAAATEAAATEAAAAATEAATAMEAAEEIATAAEEIAMAAAEIAMAAEEIATEAEEIVTAEVATVIVGGIAIAMMTVATIADAELQWVPGLSNARHNSRQKNAGQLSMCSARKLDQGSNLAEVLPSATDITTKYSQMHASNDSECLLTPWPLLSVDVLIHN